MNEQLTNPPSPEPNNTNQLLIEVVNTRTAWVFMGICERGSHLPGGRVTLETGNNVGGACSSNELGPYYNRLVYGSADQSLSCYGFAPPRHIGRDSEYVKQAGVLMFTAPSCVEGYSEVGIQGISTTSDDRSIYAPYNITQRIPSELAQQLCTQIQSNPDLFVDFFNITFPGFTSSQGNYDGLYQILTNKLFLANENTLLRFSQKYPMKKSGDSFSVPDIQPAMALELRSLSTNMTLSKPFGSGTIDNFRPIKSKIREEIDERMRQWQKSREIQEHKVEAPKKTFFQRIFGK